MYTIKTAAEALGVSETIIRRHIKRGGITPAKDGRGYALTDEELDRLQLLIDSTDNGLDKWTWIIKLRPEIARTFEHAMLENHVLTQQWWAEFLNGSWTKTKPTQSGVYLVMACDQYLGRYREFKTLDEIAQWCGYFWSVPLPLPLCEKPVCTSE
jgi:excisionase family DNA binding protein